MTMQDNFLNAVGTEVFMVFSHTNEYGSSGVFCDMFSTGDKAKEYIREQEKDDAINMYDENYWDISYSIKPYTIR